jgi:hypothetical protein
MTTACLTPPVPIVEYTAVRGRVDAARGVVAGVKVIGLTSQNGRRYTLDALRKAVDLYEGARVFVNHPADSKPRSYEQRIGTIANVTVRDDGLYGELRYNPKHPVAEQLAWDAEHSPGSVGLSHNVLARTRRDGDTQVVEEIARVISVDLVAEPATTGGLFESNEPKPQPKPIPKPFVMQYRSMPQDPALRQTAMRWRD